MDMNETQMKKAGMLNEHGLTTSYGQCLLDLQQRQEKEQTFKEIGYVTGVTFGTNLPIYWISEDDAVLFADELPNSPLFSKEELVEGFKGNKYLERI